MSEAHENQQAYLDPNAPPDKAIILHEFSILCHL